MVEKDEVRKGGWGWSERKGNSKLVSKAVR
jgi:hypothetical protein